MAHKIKVTDLYHGMPCREIPNKTRTGIVAPGNVDMAVHIHWDSDMTDWHRAKALDELEFFFNDQWCVIDQHYSYINPANFHVKRRLLASLGFLARPIYK